MGIDETGTDAVTDKIRMRQHRLEKRNVGGDTGDAKFAQGARSLVHDTGPIGDGRMHDHLGEKRVEGGTCFVA
jgi:hypothetical protein